MVRTKTGSILPLTLAAADYERLERQARAADRDPVQQARYLVKRGLRRTPPPERPARPPEQEAQRNGG